MLFRSNILSERINGGRSMILGLLTAAGSVLTSGVIIEAVTSGVGLGISVYVASKGVRQAAKRGNRK